MPDPLVGKHVVLGVTGSIAAYKAADLASKLTQAGAHVDVLLTESAAKFVSALTFRSLTHRAVVTDLFDPDSPEAIEHVALAKRADAFLVAPATANTIAKLALGLADDPVSTTALAVTAPVVVAPAMDAGMWEHPTVQQNVATLVSRGVHIAGPGAGRLASGLTGYGRMLEPLELVERLRWVLAQGGDLQGRRIVVTAGGTQEPIDPVRVVTNRSSGKMGYAVAQAARDRGAEVTLVTATSALPTPHGVAAVRVSTVADMRRPCWTRARRPTRSSWRRPSATTVPRPLRTTSSRSWARARTTGWCWRWRRPTISSLKCRRASFAWGLRRRRRT